MNSCTYHGGMRTDPRSFFVHPSSPARIKNEILFSVAELHALQDFSYSLFIIVSLDAGICKEYSYAPVAACSQESSPLLCDQDI